MNSLALSSPSFEILSMISSMMISLLYHFCSASLSSFSMMLERLAILSSVSKISLQSTLNPLYLISALAHGAYAVIRLIRL